MIYKCELCKKEIEWDEFCNNWQWCAECFDGSFEEYIESVAGPFDWIRE